MVRFGPAGNGVSFYESGAKSTWEAMGWLRNMGLSAYEYQGGSGIRIRKETAEKIGEEAQKYDIALSIHAPYYINFSSTEKDKRENSIMYIMQSLEAARWMGAKRIVIHPGACSKISRAKAMEYALEIIPRVIHAQDEAGYGDILICPEVMGKINQLGTMDEIISMCSLDERLIPAVDFGHINARTMGGLKTKEDFAQILDEIEAGLGNDRMRRIHIHFSRIEYSKGGEKRHLNFEDKVFGPDFAPLAELMAERRMEPVVICESSDTIAEDALAMQNMYLDALGRI